MLCKDCNKEKRVKNGRCLSCFRAERTRQAAKLRHARRRKLQERNAELRQQGKQVCSRCIKVRRLSEYRTSLGDGKGKQNSICDRCLSGMYKVRGVGFTYTFWRARAYSLNTTARSRLSRERRERLDLAALPFVFKPQDLIEMFEKQDGKCEYCKVVLDYRSTSVDHKVPTSRGGTHSVENVCLTCRDCNYLKNTRTAKEFRKFVLQYAQRFVE